VVHVHILAHHHHWGHKCLVAVSSRLQCTRCTKEGQIEQKTLSGSGHFFTIISVNSVPKRGRPSAGDVAAPRPPKKARSTPTTDVRKDNIGHWPQRLPLSERGRCKLCKKGIITVSCEKCKARLCFSDKKNCFNLKSITSNQIL